MPPWPADRFGRDNTGRQDRGGSRRAYARPKNLGSGRGAASARGTLPRATRLLIAGPASLAGRGQIEDVLWVVVAGAALLFIFWAYRRSEYGWHSTGGRKSKLLDFLAGLLFWILGTFLTVAILYAIVSALADNH